MYKQHKCKETVESINEGISHLHEIEPVIRLDPIPEFFHNGNSNGGRSFVTSTGDFRIVIFK